MFGLMGDMKSKCVLRVTPAGRTRLAGGRERFELSRETAGAVVQAGQADAP